MVNLTNETEFTLTNETGFPLENIGTARAFIVTLQAVNILGAGVGGTVKISATGKLKVHYTFKVCNYFVSM